MPRTQPCYQQDLSDDLRQGDDYTVALDRAGLLRQRYRHSYEMSVRHDRDYYSVWLNTSRYPKEIVAPNNAIIYDLHPSEILALERAAEEGNTQELNRLARAINWATSRPARLMRIIDLALSLDMISLVKDLVQEGNRLFPQDKPLQQALSVLSVPVAIEVRPAKMVLNLEVSKKWLKEHASQYKGQWIAVRDGVLLGVDPTLQGLYRQIGPNGKTAHTIIVKVMM